MNNSQNEKDNNIYTFYIKNNLLCLSMINNISSFICISYDIEIYEENFDEKKFEKIKKIFENVENYNELKINEIFERLINQNKIELKITSEKTDLLYKKNNEESLLIISLTHIQIAEKISKKIIKLLMNENEKLKNNMNNLKHENEIEIENSSITNKLSVTKDNISNFNTVNIYNTFGNYNNYMKAESQREMLDLIDKNLSLLSDKKNHSENLTNIKKNIINEYKINYIVKNNDENIQLFNENFVRCNKQKCYLLINNKKYPLKSTHKFSEKGQHQITLILNKKVTDFSYMFYNCNSLIIQENSDNFYDWNMENINNVYSMFSNCELIFSLKSLSNWNTKNIKNFGHFFSNCKNLNSLDYIENWNTENAENMNSMFAGCEKIKHLNSLKNWDVSKVKDFGYMFYNCVNLISVQSVKNWNTKSVLNMREMFYNCYNVKNFDCLKSWDVSNVKDMSYMFKNVDKKAYYTKPRNFNDQICNIF